MKTALAFSRVSGHFAQTDAELSSSYPETYRMAKFAILASHSLRNGKCFAQTDAGLHSLLAARGIDPDHKDKDALCEALVALAFEEPEVSRSLTDRMEGIS